MTDTVRRHGKHCFCSECLQDEMNAKDDRIEQLEKGLRESVWLQSHYAELLNMYDGGKRRSFNDAEEWLDRLEKLEKPK